MQTVHIFGDSHVVYFNKTLNLPEMGKVFDFEINVSQFFSASVKAFGKRKSTLDTKAKIISKIKKGDVVVLAFGQVDIELGLYYTRFVKKSDISLASFIEECTSSYLALINEIQKVTTKIIIKGINFPVLSKHNTAVRYTSRIIAENITNESERKIIKNKVLRNFPDFDRRRDISYIFNSKLKDMCNNNSFEYFDINSVICGVDGHVKEEFIPAKFDHHLADSVLIRKIHLNSLRDALSAFL